jgi:hypothetical protein
MRLKDLRPRYLRSKDSRSKRQRPPEQRPNRRSTLRHPAILLELACHSLMGIALGLGFALALTLIDAFGVATLIAHSFEPRMTFAIFVGTFTLAFGVGATLTGFVFTMMEER